MSFRPRGRRAAAATELAVLLPFLALVFVAGLDFARVFYHALTITNCARNGAVYASADPTHAADSAGIQAAALVDASNLSPSPNVTSSTGTDADGNPTVQVTVTYDFQMLTEFLPTGGTFHLSRTVEMRVAPVLPKNS